MLAYALPYRRFAAALADGRARLRVDVDRYSFIVSDFHRLLLAGLPGALRKSLDTSAALSLFSGMDVKPPAQSPPAEPLIKFVE